MFTFFIISLIVFHVLFPLALVGHFVLRPPSLRPIFILQLTALIMLCVYLWLVSGWSFLGTLPRTVLLAMAAMALVNGVRRFSRTIKSDTRAYGPRIGLLILIGFNAFLVGQLVRIAMAYSRPSETVALNFPLRDGHYQIGQGGNGEILNHHFSVKSQQYALDIVGVDRWGVTRKHYWQSQMEDFFIYGKDVYAPCEGIVAKARDGMSNTPVLDFAAMDAIKDEDVSGNHVIISCAQGNVDVKLSHLLPESVQVTAGDVVNTETIVGKVGNSGNSSEPHLHIQANGRHDDKLSVAMIFADHFLVRSDRITVAP